MTYHTSSPKKQDPAEIMIEALWPPHLTLEQRAHPMSEGLASSIADDAKRILAALRAAGYVIVKTEDRR